MSLPLAIQTAKAVADPTRVRLLALLANGETTVGELQQILDQSQPRVSRHLRLLDEAGLVDRFRDGQWTYYRLADTGTGRDFVAGIVELAGRDDATLEADAATLSRVKRERERDVFAERRVPRGAPTGRPDIGDVTAEFDDIVGDAPLGDVLDVGSGAGQLLCHLGARARQVVGVDVSKRMRLLARSRAHRSGVANCTIRNGTLRELPFDDAAFDLVVLDEVLGESATHSADLAEVARVLRPDGRLVILDRVYPSARGLAGGDGALAESEIFACLAEAGFRPGACHWLPGRVMEYAIWPAVPDANRSRTGTHG